VAKLAYLFVALAAVAMGAALLEFWVLARKQQTRADFVAGFFGAVALFIVFLLSEPGKLDFQMIQFVLILLTIGTLTAAMLRGAPFDRMITSAGITVLGVLYIVLLGGHLVALRVGFAPQLSKHLLSFFFLVIMVADSAASYGGKTFGRHKLAPDFSPGKTWQGAVA